MTRPTQRWPEEMAARYRAQGWWVGETLDAFLRTRAQRFADRTAVVGGATRWSYATLDHEADRVAAGLLAAGLAPGDRLIVHLPNIPEFLAVVFGCFRAGVLPVYALPAHRRTEILHLAQQADAAGYLTIDTWDGFDYRTIAATVRTECPTVRTVVIVGEAQHELAYATLREAPGAMHIDTSPSDVAFLQLSGGSTGLSKLIPRTHDDYLYSVRASADICGLSEASVYLAVLPIAHNYPMSSPGFLGALHMGGTVVLAPSPAPDVVFPLIAQERVTITAVVPPLALVWLDAAARTSADISSLQVLQVGGAKLLPEVATRLVEQFGPGLQQVFGMAEGLVNYTRLDDPIERRIGTQGCPISPDDDVLVVDDDDRPVADGVVGHLLTRGPYTIRAYYNAPEANARAFTADGYYRTGDLVIRRPDGYLVVQGRATDQINRGGEKISAEEVEDHLLAHPAVRDAAVVSIPDPWLGERSCAVIVARGVAPRPAELRSWIRGRGLAGYKIPDRILFMDALPETGVGKMSRRDLRAAVREHLAADPAMSSSSTTTD